MKKLYVATAALLASTALSMPAFAADSTEKQIQMLKEQLRMMQQQLDALQSANQAQGNAIAKEAAAREAAEKEQQKKILDAGGHLVFVNGKTEAVPPANPKVTESGTHKFQDRSLRRQTCPTRQALDQSRGPQNGSGPCLGLPRVF